MESWFNVVCIQFIQVFNIFKNPEERAHLIALAKAAGLP